MIDAKRLAQAATHAGDEKIQRQISLPWKDAARISIRNVTLRLGRAAITGAGVVLGIAFLVSVWTGKVITEGVDYQEAHSALSVTHIAGAAGVVPGQKEAAAEAAQAAARRNWLVVMSLLVCGVGITNSMLMSVTERFREIGTMKCLGALDSFIVRLFLIESVVLGFLGSVAGAIVGFLFVFVLSGLLKHGASIGAMMNWLEMLAYIAIAIGLGCLLSLIAAVAPAVRAARMPPAAALATEV